MRVGSGQNWRSRFVCKLRAVVAMSLVAPLAPPLGGCTRTTGSGEAF